MKQFQIVIGLSLCLGGFSCTTKNVAATAAANPAPQVAGGDSGSGWASSGGELLKDSQNPWWVKNTTTVNYCVQVDSAGISASPDHIRHAVEFGLGYWKKEFARPVPYLSSPFNRDGYTKLFKTLGVGTQKFIEIPCGPNVDIAFQFGLGTLTKEQLAHIPDPRSYVGVTERTSYDDVNLRGKGFVFIASDQGAGQYDGDAATQGGAWSNDVALYTIIMHELGHVFGIPHIGAELGLMSQQLPEALVSNYLRPIELSQVVDLGDDDAYGDFFFPALENHFCMNPPSDMPTAASQFLGLQASENCLWFTYDDATSELQAATSAGEKAPKRALGKITGAAFGPEDFDMVITLRMNSQQTIFSPDLELDIGPANGTSPTKLPYLIGPFRLSFDGIGGVYTAPTPGAPTIPVMVRLTPGGLTLYATQNGTTTQIVSWQNSD